VRHTHWALALFTLSIAAAQTAAIHKPPVKAATSKPATASKPATSKPAAKPQAQAVARTNSIPQKAVGAKPGVHPATTAHATPSKPAAAPTKNTYAATQSRASTTARGRTQTPQYSRYSNATAHGRRPAQATNRTQARRPVYNPPQVQPSTDRYKEIQSALLQKGYLHGEPSGAWDADSIDAMKRFQKDQNLDADGKLSSLSLIALGLGPKRTLTASTVNPATAAPQAAAPASVVTPPVPQPQVPPRP